MLSFGFACQKDNINPDYLANTLSQNVLIDRYDIFLDVDVPNYLFRSDQSTYITPQLTTSSITFELHSDLTVDSISLEELDILEFKPIKWDILGEVKHQRGEEVDIFKRYQITAFSPLAAQKPLRLFIRYLLEKSAIGSNPKNELLKFDVNNKSVRALHPVNGLFPYFGGLVVAPFQLKVKHSREINSCIPGNLIKSEIEGNNVVETFEATVPQIPVIFLADQRKIEFSGDNVVIDYLLIPGQFLPNEIVDLTVGLTNLYNHDFGNPGSNSYRFAFVQIPQSSISGESKGNAIYFTYRDQYHNNWDESNKLDFFQLISHEVFHNWNIWYVKWQGEFYEWFVEGSAGFMSAWAAERVINQDAGNDIRSTFVEGFINRKGFSASKTLVDIQKSGDSELSLIYSYGALVWEQLRQKLGDEAFLSGLYDFFSEHHLEVARAQDLFLAFERYSPISVSVFLDQWLHYNAKVDLSIEGVIVIPKESSYETAIEINIESNRQSELFWDLGYQTDTEEKMRYIPMHTTEVGSHTVTFTSSARPVFIQLDPAHRVPQMEVDNDYWSDIQ